MATGIREESWWKQFGRTVSGTVLEALYPNKCALCGRIGSPAICGTCRSRFRSCPKGTLVAPPGLDESHAVFYYEDRAGQAVRRLKYERVTSLGAPMAELVAGYAAAHLQGRYDVVVPVPISRAREQERGFNQAALLAEGLDSGSGQSGLLRIRYTKPQVGRNREERTQNLIGAFRASDEVNGKKILLIDDVVTSGGTATACALALREAGASRVLLLTFCAEMFGGVSGV